MVPVIYEDKDSSDEESDDTMETDPDEQPEEQFHAARYIDASDDDMSD